MSPYGVVSLGLNESVSLLWTYLILKQYKVQLHSYLTGIVVAIPIKYENDIQ